MINYHAVEKERKAVRDQRKLTFSTTLPFKTIRTDTHEQ